MHDLHADVILGRNHSFQIWAEREKSSAPGSHTSPGSTLTQPSRQSWAQKGSSSHGVQLQKGKAK